MKDRGAEIDFSELNDDQFISAITAFNGLEPTETLRADLQYFLCGDLGQHQYMRPMSGGYKEARKFVSELQKALGKLSMAASLIDELCQASGVEAAKRNQESEQEKIAREQQLRKASFYAHQLIRAESEHKLILYPTPLMWLSARLCLDPQLKEVVDAWASVANQATGRNVPQRDLHEMVLVGLVGVMTLAHGCTSAPLSTR